MSKKAKSMPLSAKLYLFILNLKEDKNYNLNPTKEDESIVFVFKNKEALCRFLIDKNIDISSKRMADCIKYDLIMKEFEDGTVICPKTICQYFCGRATKTVEEKQQNSQRHKSIVKYRISQP